MTKLEIPEHFPIKKGEIVFVGRTTTDEILDDNKISFELKPIDDGDIPNKFTVKIPTNQLNSVEEYDITFKFDYLNGMYNNLEYLKIILKKL